VPLKVFLTLISNMLLFFCGASSFWDICTFWLPAT